MRVFAFEAASASAGHKSRPRPNRPDLSVGNDRPCLVLLGNLQINKVAISSRLPGVMMLSAPVYCVSRACETLHHMYQDANAPFAFFLQVIRYVRIPSTSSR
jgi:hypothetical protein